MDYVSLFDNREMLHGGNYCSMLFREGGKFSMVCNSGYPMIFILKGKLCLDSITRAEIPEGHFVVADCAKLRRTECDPGTILFRYAPPQKLARLLSLCTSAFRTHCSTPVKMSASVREWMDELMQRMTSDREMNEEECCLYRRRLATALLEYPEGMLNELYMPFRACSRSSCEECRLDTRESPVCASVLSDAG